MEPRNTGAPARVHSSGTGFFDPSSQSWPGEPESPCETDAGEPESRAEPSPEKSGRLSERVLAVLRNGPLAKSGIAAALGQDAVSGPLNRAIRNLLAAGAIERTIPDRAEQPPAAIPAHGRRRAASEAAGGARARVEPGATPAGRTAVSPSPFTEDNLVQKTAAEYLEERPGWESVYAHDREDFGPGSLLGRGSDREVVLRRPLREALRALNPGLPDKAYDDALRQIVATDSSKSIVAANREKYHLLREGVSVAFADAEGSRKRAGFASSTSRRRRTTASWRCASFGSGATSTAGAPISSVSSTGYRCYSWSARTSIGISGSPSSRTTATTATPFPISSITTP